MFKMLSLCVCFCVCMYFDAHAEVRGQLCGIWPLLPSLCRFWGLNSGRQTCTANTFLYLLNHLVDPVSVFNKLLFLK